MGIYLGPLLSYPLCPYYPSPITAFSLPVSLLILYKVTVRKGKRTLSISGCRLRP
jgi:hypothetical protein